MRLSLNCLLLCGIISFLIVASYNVSHFDELKTDITDITIQITTEIQPSSNQASTEVQTEETTKKAKRKPAKKKKSDQKNKYKIELSKQDEELLARIGMCEVGGESLRSIALVMRVVLNRVESPVFPDTIYNVLYQYNQFSPVTSGWIKTVVPSEKCYEALEMIKSGWDETDGALYFEACEGESWQSRNLNFLFIFDGVRYYR